MFCPSCGARNVTGARTCAECGRVLPGAHLGRTLLDEPAATVPDSLVPDSPVPAPPEPPRILKRPAPLAPPPLDVVPPNPQAQGLRVGANDPTLIRRSPPRPAPVTMPTGVPLSDASVTAPTSDPIPVLPDDATVPVPRAISSTADEPPAAVAPPAPAPRSPPPPTRSAGPDELASPAPSEAAPAAPAPRAGPLPTTRPPPPSLSQTHRPAAPSAVSTSEHARSTGAGTAGPQATPVLAPVLQLAPPLRWAAAGLADVVIGAVLALGAAAAGLAVEGVRVALQPVVDFIYASPVAAVSALVVAPLVALVVYHGVVVAIGGATVGQRLLRLRVVRMSTGEPPGPGRALVRGLMTSVGVLLCGAGPLWGMFVDRRRRGLGDLVARTIVVVVAGRSTPGSGGSDL